MRSPKKLKNLARAAPLAQIPSLVVVGVTALFLADSALAQPSSQSTTINTGLGGGVDNVLQLVLRAAQAIAFLVGVLGVIRASMKWSQGAPDAGEAVKQAGVGIVLAAVAVGLVELVYRTAAG